MKHTTKSIKDIPADKLKSICNALDIDRIDYSVKVGKSLYYYDLVVPERYTTEVLLVVAEKLTNKER